MLGGKKYLYGAKDLYGVKLLKDEWNNVRVFLWFLHRACKSNNYFPFADWLKQSFFLYVLFQVQLSVVVRTQTKIQLYTVESFGLVTGHQTASISLLAVETKR